MKKGKLWIINHEDEPKIYNFVKTHFPNKSFIVHDDIKDMNGVIVDKLKYFTKNGDRLEIQ